MNIQPRQQYGLGSIVKSIGKGVKKAVSGVKDFAKSDIGKMAILAAGGYYAGGGNLFGLQRANMTGFGLGNLPGIGGFLAKGTGPNVNNSVFSKVLGSKAGKTLGVFAGGSALGALMGAAEEGDQEAIAATRDVGALKGYLASYYSNLGYSADQIATNVERDTAEYTSGSGGYAVGGRVGAMYGGRIGFKDGTDENLVGIETLKLGDYDLEGFQKKGKGNTLMFGSDDLKILSQALDYGELSDLSDRQKEKIKESIIRAKAGIINPTELNNEIGMLRLEPDAAAFLKAITPDETMEKVFFDKEGDARIGVQKARKLMEDVAFGGQKNPSLSSDMYNKLGDEYIQDQKKATQREINFNKEYGEANFLNFKDGGRIGYSGGTDFENYLKGRKQFEKEQGKEQLYREYKEDMRRQKIYEQRNMVAYGGRMKLAESLDPKIREIVIDLMDNEGFEFGEAVKEAYRRVQSTENKANGGRMGYAMGSDDLVDQASGIMNLPKRVNNAGVKELDLRDSGGFIPPVGVKEKADDIPAMLSNNEFVFTADSVREFGDGDVNKGAQRMYDMMKKLEKGGRV